MKRLPLSTCLILVGCVRAMGGHRADDAVPAAVDVSLDRRLASEQPWRDAPAGVDGACPVEPPAPSCGCVEEDCDGLPTYRDPEPSTCNALLYEERFQLATGTRWQTYGGLWDWSCSWLHQKATDPTLAWARAQTGGLATAGYLVEARVRLGAIGNPDRWGVGIVARYDHPDAYMLCEARVDTKLVGFPPVTDPDLRLEVRSGPAETDSTACWPPDRVHSFEGAPGSTYYLQIWYTDHFVSASVPECQTAAAGCKATVCRIFDESKALRIGVCAFWQYPRAQPALPTTPGSVGLRTYGRAASFDYVRAFKLQSP